MSETLGQQLKQARENKKLSLEEASEATHIRLHYLQALEADDFSVMPSSAQARGFLRNYAGFLGVDVEAVVAGIPRPAPGAPEEISGPMPQAEIAPPPPEPVTRRRQESPAPSRPGGWRAALAGWRSRLGKKASPSPEEQTEPRDPKGPPAGGNSAGKSETEAPDSAASAEKTALQAAAPPAPAGEGTQGRSTIFSRLRIGKRADQPPGKLPEAEPAAVEQAPAALPTPAVPERVPAPLENGESAEQIFREIGAQLRKQRELLSLTPDEVERHIHVRVAFIEALESGDFDELPSAVQTRGMLANYAGFLDLDADALLLRFADSLQASHRLRYPERPGRSRQPLAVRPNLPPLRGFVAGDMIFGLAVVVMVIALVVWGLGRVFAVRAQPVAVLPTAPSISEVLAGAQVPTALQEVTLIPIDDTPFAAEVSTAAPEVTEEPASVDPNVAVALAIVATERTFMRVIVDGEETFNGRVMPGTVYTYDAAASIEVLTGNGAALRVTYNGRDMGLLGNFGQVVDYIYTADAVVTPVPPVSPTGSPTLPVSPTPTSTPTATPTVSRTPSAN
ncbi:MAG: RodZ domain-containing protein [Bacteroidota bacterium]